MKKNRSGETLVETIVTFAVVLLIVMAATMAALGAIRLNRRAIDTSLTLEAACAAVEEDAGTAEGGARTMTISFEEDAPDAFTDAAAEITFKAADPLWYFVPKEADNG